MLKYDLRDAYRHEQSRFRIFTHFLRSFRYHDPMLRNLFCSVNETKGT